MSDYTDAMIDRMYFGGLQFAERAYERQVEKGIAWLEDMDQSHGCAWFWMLKGT